MTQFIPVTILAKASDPMNKKIVYIRPDTITRFSPGEVREDDVHLVGISKVTPGTVIWFEGGNFQMFRELPEYFVELFASEEKVLLETYGGL